MECLAYDAVVLLAIVVFVYNHLVIEGWKVCLRWWKDRSGVSKDVSKQSSPSEELIAERSALRLQADPLNTPSTFAQYAKLKRKINALDRKIAQMQANSNEGAAQSKPRQSTALRSISVILQALPAVIKWSFFIWVYVSYSDMSLCYSPLEEMTDVWYFGPLSRRLDRWNLATTSLVVWLLICDRAARRVKSVLM